MSYAGFYINLDRSAARRAAVEAQLAKFGLSDRYHRFAAVEGNPAGIINPGIAPGEVGCLLSHLTLLKQNVGAGLHVHVMEDDVLLSRHTRPAIETVIASGLIDDYDLLFTETFIPPLARELGRLKALYDRQVASAPGPGERRLNLAVVEYFHATSSYIANKNAIGRVVAVLDRAVAEGAKMPVDFLIRDAYLKQTLKVGCLFPFVTAVQFDWTGEQTITGRRRDARTAAALALARRSFFVDANIAELSALADKLIVPSGDPHARLLGQVLALHADPRASTNVPDQS